MAVYDTDYDGLYIDPENFECIVSEESPVASFKLEFISSEGDITQTADLRYYILNDDLLVSYNGDEKRTYISNRVAYSKSSVREEFNKFYKIEKYNGVGDDIRIKKQDISVIIDKNFPLYIRRSFDDINIS